MGRHIPVEAKSGETIPPLAVRNLAWGTDIPDNPAEYGLLAHGGSQRFRFKGFEVLPWFIA